MRLFIESKRNNISYIDKRSGAVNELLPVIITFNNTKFSTNMGEMQRVADISTFNKLNNNKCFDISLLNKFNKL